MPPARNALAAKALESQCRFQQPCSCWKIRRKAVWRQCGKTEFDAETQGRGEFMESNRPRYGFIFAALLLCSAVSQLPRVLQRFSRSADSLVRVLLACGPELADKAVRAPLVAASPRHASASKIYSCFQNGQRTRRPGSTSSSPEIFCGTFRLARKSKPA